MSQLITLEEATARIASGRPLSFAGSRALLERLPRGKWIGGTIPYFMGPEGGVVTHERLFVTELPPETVEVTVASYGADTVASLPGRTHPAGFALVILPAFSAVHLAWGRDSLTFPALLDAPLIGWIAGFDLRPGAAPDQAFVFDGTTGEKHADRAVALHVRLERSVLPRMDLVNIFEPGEGPAIRFPELGFGTRKATVDGEEVDFAAWLTEQHLDTRLPLVADYAGALVNVSFQAVDVARHEVRFYAPVFPEMTYRLARPVPDYAKAFNERLEGLGGQPVFTCNCILNFLHGELEGRRTGRWQGPITFGEIAWLLVNQTMTWLRLERA